MRVTEKKSEELNVGDLFTKIGGYAWNISMVNDHVWYRLTRYRTMRVV